MASELAIGIFGLGRMGSVHAKHILELEREEGLCRLAALVDTDVARAKRFQEQYACTAPIFSTVEEYLRSGLCQATMIVTPTEKHREHAAALVQAGHRVLLEKPLTGTLQGDIDFCAELDRQWPNALMLAFQRRFDQALAFGRDLMQAGTVGKVFKIYSALEDSGPAPNGYQSDGILPDMSVHNVDEILWLTGRMPDKAMAVGSRIYSHTLTTCKEDFDDATLYMWFGEELQAQVQVSRNHVSGYRVETIIFGDQGQIQIGHFAQQPDEIIVEAFGRRGQAEPIVRRTFPGGKGGNAAPEFVDRFGPAYKAEVAAFLGCCNRGEAFPTTHNDGLRAQKVIAAGMQALLTKANAKSL